MFRNLLIITKKLINRETISYLIFGILTTLVDAITFFLFNKELNIDYVLSTIIAWCLAVIFAYITNKIWVFQSKNNNIITIIKELFSFLLARLASLGFTIIWMYITVECFKIDSMASKLLANIFVVILNYYFSKLVIFKKKT